MKTTKQVKINQLPHIPYNYYLYRILSD